MKVTIFGAGYVGLVTGACFAEIGHDVVVVDVDATKVEKLNKGLSPIYEPGLNKLLTRNLQSRRLHFTLDAAEAIQHSECIFIAVGTPPNDEGSADLKFVLAVARQIGIHTQAEKLIISKSTVPVGTAEVIRREIAGLLKDRELNVPFHVCSNPEFLKEGAAIKDFLEPDRVVIGVDTEFAEAQLKALYAPLLKDNLQALMVVDIASAELIKYASNAMLATKISFMNEMSQIAERVGADIEKVKQGMSMDSRIGPHFINPGCGYGGSCFPKDVTALRRTALDIGVSADMLVAVEAVNQKQKRVLVQKIHQYYDHQLENKVFAIWGLAFKPNTDDTREASSRIIIESLLQAGAKVQCFDPVAMSVFAEDYPASRQLVYADNAMSALAEADALIIVTEWDEFKNADIAGIARAIKDKVIFDGRNMYSPAACHEAGLTYFGIGYGDSINKIKGAA